MERLAHTHSDDRSELLSAYSDNAVDVVERRRVEEYIQDCTACAQELRELRMFKELLGDLPQLQPLRSFTLDPYTAPRPRWLLFPTLRLASVMAALLLFIVVGVDTLSPLGSDTSAQTAASSAEMSQRRVEEAPEAAAQLQAEPATGGAGGAAAGTAGATGGAGAAGAPPAPAASTGSAAAAAAAEAAPPAGDAAGGVTAMGGASDAPPAAGAAGGDAQGSFKGEEPAGLDTTTLDTDAGAADNATPSPFDTTLLVELALALAAVAFGIGAFVAWRRGI